eukprot:CAMPEP_0194585560 /NCGR_PEP_ID=MMETSP0292-20121207/17844_1 /TAXON_ID=39354 /ORGANISM="Heterosigma akashiwo, Strain CCMP2393" /LENGTH=125 /DNA_ID=CAMNT_0039441069 /DNA_START=272 /DNA_END=646 /DNA_ORIENTATION=+
MELQYELPDRLPLLPDEAFPKHLAVQKVLETTLDLGGGGLGERGLGQDPLGILQHVHPAVAGIPLAWDRGPDKGHGAGGELDRAAAGVLLLVLQSQVAAQATGNLLPAVQAQGVQVQDAGLPELL